MKSTFLKAVQMSFIIISLALMFSCSYKNTVSTKAPVEIQDTELESFVITKDTVLSGEIIIKGSLIVKKNANLTILPGTVIRFKRFYKDDDEISDSDMNIEGSIHAVGTETEPIIFTSYEKDKKTGDWKFIMVNFARASEFKYCIVEYAFSGVQIHFTKATVEHCVFRNNKDGIRFSTAKINITKNEIYGNVNGIRYEERKAPATITYNNINNNKVGIFCVIKSDDASTIENNNIFDNEDYNVKLGIKQDVDITMTNNFWGMTTEEEISGKIFDKGFDELLGKVNFTPFLKEKIWIE